MKHNLLRILTRTQVFVIALGIIAQLSFVATIKHYLITGNWGYPRIGWIIPNQVISFGWLHIPSDALITYHLISGYCLYLGLLFQFCLMLFLKRNIAIIRIHRALGALIIFLALPFFLILSLALAGFLIHNPINKLLFAIIPMLIAYGLVKGFLAAQHDKKECHVDGMFLALVLMNTASVFRILIGILFLIGIPTQYLFSNGEPNHIAALGRTILMILILIIGFKSSGRLTKNKLPIYALVTASLLAFFIHLSSMYG